MPKKARKARLPMAYSNTVEFDDERFVKIRIKVMHNGINRNRTSFHSDAIEKARKTISNIPILAFVKKEDGTDESDYGAHEFEIKVIKDELKYVYLGRPIGIIPESNNYAYEADSTGRKFVYVDAYIWKDYANEALDIFLRDGQKKVSMEINIDDYRQDGEILDVIDYSYKGVALLGDDVPEGMLGARAELVYSKSTISDFMFEMKESLKGGKEMDKEKVFSQDEDENENKQGTDGEQAEPEAQENETKTETTEKEEVQKETLENAGEEAKKGETQPGEDGEEAKEDFSLEALNKKIADLEKENSNLNSENASLKSKVQDLESFKQQTLETEKEKKIETLFSRFLELSALEEYSKLKESAKEKDLEDLETQLYALKGKHGIFSKTTEENSKDSKDSYKKAILQYNQQITDEPVWAMYVKNEEE